MKYSSLWYYDKDYAIELNRIYAQIHFITKSLDTVIERLNDFTEILNNIHEYAEFLKNHGMNKKNIRNLNQLLNLFNEELETIGKII